MEGPVELWEAIRDGLRTEILDRGYDAGRNTFVQCYGAAEADASLLQLTHVGFLDYDDPRMLGTVAFLERELLNGQGLLLRYRSGTGVDGLEPGENPFLACSFWLAEQYAHTGRLDEAIRLMDQLVGYANEVGLLSEEYDTVNGRMAGNYPQAFSHLALVRAADAIHAAEAGLLRRRSQTAEPMESSP